MKSVLCIVFGLALALSACGSNGGEFVFADCEWQVPTEFSSSNAALHDPLFGIVDKGGGTTTIRVYRKPYVEPDFARLPEVFSDVKRAAVGSIIVHSYTITNEVTQVSEHIVDVVDDGEYVRSRNLSSDHARELFLSCFRAEEIKDVLEWFE